MRRPIIHIVGAGFSGLSAAVHLAAAGDADVVVHERGARAGGKRRSIYDETLGIEIDSGNYFVLSSWRSTLAAIDMIGARGQWREPEPLAIAFADMASGERWTLRPNAGRAPWWILSQGRRAPRTIASDYYKLAKLLHPPRSALVADFAPAEGAASERIWRPFILAALNIDPARASARLAGAILRETFGAGARGARMMFPSQDFAHGFTEPAVQHLRKRGVAVRFERDLRSIDFEGERVAALEFENDRVDLASQDSVILCVPPDAAAALTPGLRAPNEFSTTVTAHFAISPPSETPRALGAINGPFHWLFRSSDRISLGVRDAGPLTDAPRDKIALAMWPAAAALIGLSDAMPAWRVIRQKRATFAATPAQDALRPPCETQWRNLFLAGAYVQNGLPETIESAVRSGEVAARRVRGVEA